jgi:hypothetical protein
MTNMPENSQKIEFFFEKLEYSPYIPTSAQSAILFISKILKESEDENIDQEKNNSAYRMSIPPLDLAGT